MSAFVLPARNRAPSEPFGFAVLKVLTFEDVHPLLITVGDSLHRRRARDRSGTPINQRIPERSASHGEADEPWNGRSRRQPRSHALGVLAATEHDAVNILPAVAPRRRNDVD